MALEPKRQRGRQRVAAILEAGAAVFAEKGYDAATMTEIAARADTAIGSLYRFFPTKEVLADALLDRYGDRMTTALDDIAERAPRLSPPALADTLVDLMLELREHRAAILALLDARSDAERSQLRAKIRRRMAAILSAANAQLPASRAQTIAPLLVYVLKAVPTMAKEPAERRDALIAEARAVARLYLTSVLSA
jgi:AcrR family transcriptional regulator